MATKEQQDIDPSAAVESLRSAPADVGIVPSSLNADDASPQLRFVELGRVRSDAVEHLAEVLQRGGRE